MQLTLSAFLVDDYDTGIAFFCEVLGWRLECDEDQGRKRWVVVAAPLGGRLLLARAEGTQRDAIGAQHGGRVGFFLEVSDFEVTRAKMEAAGVYFEEPTRHEPYGKVAVWRDPWGNRWDLLEPSTVS